MTKLKDFEIDNEAKLRAEIKKLRKEKEEEERKVMEMDKENQELKRKMGPTVVRKWMDNDGTFKPYPDKISEKIEGLKVGQVYKYTFIGNNQIYNIFRDSETEGEQVNLSTQYARQIKRTKSHGVMNRINYPKWWKLTDIDLAQYAKPKIVELNLKESPAVGVIDIFQETCPNYTVVKIESVQNQMLYDSYWNELKKLMKLLGEEKINTDFLFHGTKRSDVMDLIQVQGFRKEFNTIGVYGKGTYFAKNASYSVAYSCGDVSNNVYKMFCCSVIIGESHLGKREYELTTWPKKENGLIYDTLVDKIDDPSIYVIHENDRAYPMFVIYFKKP